MSSRWGWLPALPALVLLFAFFLFPVVRMLGFSLEAGSLDWYAKALGEQLYLRVFWNTFEIALIVTVVCLLLGYPLGFLIATTTPGWATLGFIFVLLPLWTSVLVRTYAWMVLLGRNGVFNRWLIEAGIVSDPLPLLHNFTGVLIGMVHVLLPYMVLPIYGAVRRLDPAIVAAAEGLGASDWRIFWRIYLPLTITVAVFMFAVAIAFPSRDPSFHTFRFAGITFYAESLYWTFASYWRLMAMLFGTMPFMSANDDSCVAQR